MTYHWRGRHRRTGRPPHDQHCAYRGNLDIDGSQQLVET
jgi:hypothetical protein